MRNRAKIALDFHGTFVTPGHVYWCAGGTFAGRFAPLIDILRDDGVIQHADGTLIRAATGCAVGSPDDEQFWALLTCGDAAGNDRVLDRRHRHQRKVKDARQRHSANQKARQVH